MSTQYAMQQKLDEAYVTDLQQDTQVWREHMIRNNDALAKWKKAREEELAFQRNVVRIHLLAIGLVLSLSLNVIALAWISVMIR